ncbi:MAG: ATP synthase F1 subunit delta [Sphingomonadales bacterium]|nr:ATP synthase F1 subunit delta [Sphingomonadales bacterium]
MPNPRLAARYAKSLLDLSIEKDQLEKVYADMLWLQGVCKSNRDFVKLLRSPIIKADTKEKIVTAVTTGQVSELTAAFNRLLIVKARESYLPEIITAFITSYKEKKGIKTIRLTTAVAASQELKASIVEQVKKSAGFSLVELEEKVDPALIGGFVLQIDDQLVDASVAYDLRAIAMQFNNNDFIYKIK